MEYEGFLMQAKNRNISEIWNEYYINYRKEVFSFAFSCVHNIHQADDIVQDVFIKLRRTLLKGKEIVNTKGWLYKTTIRTCLDWKKSFWNKIFYKNESNEKDIPIFNEKDFSQDNNFKNLNINLKKLPTKQRVAISLRFYKDMQINEIANLMQISQSSVKTHIGRGLKKLKKFLEEK